MRLSLFTQGFLRDSPARLWLGPQPLPEAPEQNSGGEGGRRRGW